MLANWYYEFMAKKLTAGVCYSPLRLGFVTRAGVPFRAEEYPQCCPVCIRLCCNLKFYYFCLFIVLI